MHHQTRNKKRISLHKHLIILGVFLPAAPVNSRKAASVRVESCRRDPQRLVDERRTGALGQKKCVGILFVPHSSFQTIDKRILYHTECLLLFLF